MTSHRQTSLEDDLEQFRERWKQEVSQQQADPTPTSAAETAATATRLEQVSPSSRQWTGLLTACYVPVLSLSPCLGQVRLAMIYAKTNPRGAPRRIHFCQELLDGNMCEFGTEIELNIVNCTPSI